MADREPVSADEVRGIFKGYEDPEALDREERDRWIRLFNRLEAAVSRHRGAKSGTGFTDDADDALHDAHRKVLKDAAVPAAGAVGEGHESSDDELMAEGAAEFAEEDLRTAEAGIGVDREAVIREVVEALRAEDRLAVSRGDVADFIEARFLGDSQPEGDNDA